MGGFRMEPAGRVNPRIPSKTDNDPGTEAQVVFVGGEVWEQTGLVRDGIDCIQVVAGVEKVGLYRTKQEVRRDLVVEAAAHRDGKGPVDYRSGTAKKAR